MGKPRAKGLWIFATRAADSGAVRPERVSAGQVARLESIFSRSIFLQDCRVLRMERGTLVFLNRWARITDGEPN